MEFVLYVNLRFNREKSINFLVVSCINYLHKRCFDSWTRTLQRTHSDITLLPCGLCREMIPLTAPVRNFLTWHEKLEKILVIMAPILGVALGFGMTQVSSLERICSISYRVFNISPKIAFPLICGGIGGIGSYLLVKSHSFVSQWIQKVSLLIHNKIHDTSMAPIDVTSYKMDIVFSPAEQRKLVFELYIDICLITVLERLRETPFLREDKDLVSPVVEAYQKLDEDETKKNELAQAMIEDMQSRDADKYDELAEVGAAIFKTNLSDEDEKLREQLTNFVKGSILDYFMEQGVASDILNNSVIEMRLLAVSALEKMKSYFDFGSTQKDWIELLTELQAECNIPNSTLITRLLASEPGQSLNSQTLLELFCDEQLFLELIKVLIDIKKEEDPEKYHFDINVSDT